MPSLVVIGAQWGDEGKGKLVDYLTSNADWVVRFQGGNNAGHTLVVGSVQTKLHLVPSGILRARTRCLICAGVVVDAEFLLEEIKKLRSAGIEVNPSRLIVDRDVNLILDYHRLLDNAREEALGKDKIGTTGRGIGPAYEDRAARCGVRLAELCALKELAVKLEKITADRNRYLQDILGSSKRVDFTALWGKVERWAEEITPYMGNCSLLLDGAVKRGERIVFEGAQGALLDNTHGTVPFVTSSNTIAGAATTGCGIGPRAIDYVLGVGKAYSTRVGSGPFPTELGGTLADTLRKRGAEFGTTTGRPRRIGWFDAPAMKRAVRLNGIESLVLTKLDVLTGLDTIKICINYTLDDKKIDDVPSLAQDIERIVPEYIEVEGWKEDLSAATKWHHLPAKARFYLSTLAEIVGCPISIVSVGPERDSTIFSSSAAFLKNFMCAE